MKSILITGGAGFIGYHLALRFSDFSKNSVYIIDNFFKKKTKDSLFLDLLKKKNVHFINHDLTKPRIFFFKKKLKFDYIYHFSAINGTKFFYNFPEKVLNDNILININFLKFLENIKFKKLIYSSSSEVYSESFQNKLVKVPTSEEAVVSFNYPYKDRFSYGISKFVGEYQFQKFCERKKKQLIILRFHNIYGPRMGTNHVISEFINKLKRNKKKIEIYGYSNTRSFCYIDDAINYITLITKNSKKLINLYNVGNSDEEIKILKLLKKIIFLLKIKKVKIYKFLSPKFSAPRRKPNIEKSVKLTKYKPRFSLDYGLRKTINFYY
jgi:nucleoside-diphosphate-sugar epimerase